MPGYRPIWIAEFLNMERLREKLGSKYGIDVDEFERLARFNSNLRGYDEFHPEHGLRTVIQIEISRGKFMRTVI